MKGSTLALTAATAFATSASALQYEKRDNPKTLHVPFARSEGSPALRERMRLRRRGNMAKRDKTVSSTIENAEGGSLYFANISLGTPAQEIMFHVDTGSSDLWANVPDSQLCQMSAQQLAQQGMNPCSASGTFDANKSSTYKLVNSDFQIKYADNTGAQGDYGSDVLQISGATVNGQEFGLGLQSSSSEGVMGIGYPTLEAITQNSNAQPYKNLPQQLVAQGLINTPSYSLWLDDIQAPTGNLLFGGVDTSKFTGSLTTLPIVPESGEYVEMVVGLSGISVDQGGKLTAVDTQAIPTLLDSGSTLMYLPTQVAMQIYNAVGATYRKDQQLATCKCSLGQNTGETIDFNFSGQTIKVALSQLVINEGSQQTCLFGIMPTDSAPFTLGDTFIRSAYLVYDLDANTISMAQTNFNPPSSSNVQEITNGTAGVPSAAPATSTAAVTLGSGGGQRYNGGAPTGLSSLSAGTPASSLGQEAKVLGVAAAGMAVGAAMLFSSL